MEVLEKKKGVLEREEQLMFDGVIYDVGQQVLHLILGPQPGRRHWEERILTAKGVCQLQCVPFDVAEFTSKAEEHDQANRMSFPSDLIKLDRHVERARRLLRRYPPRERELAWERYLLQFYDLFRSIFEMDIRGRLKGYPSEHDCRK